MYEDKNERIGDKVRWYYAGELISEETKVLQSLLNKVESRSQGIPIMELSYEEIKQLEKLLNIRPESRTSIPLEIRKLSEVLNLSTQLTRNYLIKRTSRLVIKARKK
jgi:hypothetical protein